MRFMGIKKVRIVSGQAVNNDEKNEASDRGKTYEKVE